MAIPHKGASALLMRCCLMLTLLCACFGSAVAVSGTGQSKTPQSLVTPAFAGFFPDYRKWHKSGFDHRNDHRQKNLWFSSLPWYNGRNWISGYSAVGSALDLGSRGRAFESLYSDQNPSEINDFRGIFLFFVYCGAKFEKAKKHSAIALICTWFSCIIF